MLTKNIFKGFHRVNRFFRNLEYVHRPFLILTGAFALGIYIGQAFNVEIRLLILAIFIFLLSGSAFIRFKGLSSLFMLIVIVLTGSLYIKSYSFIPEGHIFYIARYYKKEPIKVRGTIISDVEHKRLFNGEKTNFIIKVESVYKKKEWIRTEGKLLVNIFRYEKVNYGDFLSLEGRIHFPFNFGSAERFSYRNFLKRKKIYHILSVKKEGKIQKINSDGKSIKGFILITRNALKRILQDNLSENEANVMQAIVLGVRNNVPKNIKHLFEITGVAHLLAISALHLGIVSFIIFLLIKMLPVSRVGKYFLCIFLLIFYSALTGARPSVVRASVMAIIFLLSYIFEKEGDVLNTLSMSGFIILLMNPQNLFDLGFQLSFISVFSIINLFPIFKQICAKFYARKGHWLSKVILDSFFISIAAYLGVAGLIAYYFQIITPVAIIVNLFVIPLFSMLVVLGLGILIVHYVFPQLTIFFALCIKVLLNIIVGSIFLFSKVPGAFYEIERFHLGYVVAYYAFFCIFICSISLYSKYLRKEL